MGMSLTLIKKIHPLALGLLFLIDLGCLHVLSSNLNLIHKLLLFSAFLLLHFLLCIFEYSRIKLEMEWKSHE
jgi:hypothetical protein